MLESSEGGLLVEVYVSNSSHSLPVFQVKLAAHDPYDEYIYMTYILGGPA